MYKNNPEFFQVTRNNWTWFQSGLDFYFLLFYKPFLDKVKPERNRSGSHWEEETPKTSIYLLCASHHVLWTKPTENKFGVQAHNSNLLVKLRKLKACTLGSSAPCQGSLFFFPAGSKAISCDCSVPLQGLGRPILRAWLLSPKWWQILKNKRKM